METAVHGDEDMERFAAEYVSRLKQHSAEAVVVALSGDLGAGKTTFARGILRSLGVGDPITSPTFVIQKVYVPLRGPFKSVIHIDAYRLKSAEELLVLGWRELLKDANTLILIEWPERVSELIPEKAHRVSFRFGEGPDRFITSE